MVDEEFGEEHQTRDISAIDDANLFYKAVGGSKKGRLYGLGSEGHVLTATKAGSFVTPQPVQPQLTVDDIIAAPAFKAALGKILDERERQNAERQRESDQQMAQLRG